MRGSFSPFCSEGRLEKVVFRKVVRGGRQQVDGKLAPQLRVGFHAFGRRLIIRQRIVPVRQRLRGIQFDFAGRRFPGKG